MEMGSPTLGTPGGPVPILLPLLAHLSVGELVPGLLPVGEDLPEHHAEAPDIALGGEFTIQDALGRHPADGQHGPAPHLPTAGLSARQGCSCFPSPIPGPTNEAPG